MYKRQNIGFIDGTADTIAFGICTSPATIPIADTTTIAKRNAPLTFLANNIPASIKPNKVNNTNGSVKFPN